MLRVQITAGSLLGRFGEKTMHLVEKWLAEDRVHFFASDAHNLSGRPLRLKEAYEKTVLLRGEEIAQALFRIIRSQPTKDGHFRSSPSSRVPPRAARSAVANDSFFSEESVSNRKRRNSGTHRADGFCHGTL